ncbi:MAG: HAMP domain-containing protein [Acidobacteriota bacterium]|nr:HAMP domain-containing protein [Acidobacteriota bacterium]
MSLRQRLLILFSLTVAASVAAVAWTVLVRMRTVFEERDQQETALFVSQFQREFQTRSSEVAASVERLAVSDRARSMAFEIAQSDDSAQYVTAAQTMAQDAQLDFLEIVGPDGNMVSSAQWPARFGYPEPAVKAAPQGAFLKQEELPDGSTTLGLFAVRSIGNAAPSVTLIGGERLDKNFLAELPIAPGMTIGLYTMTGSSSGQAATAAIPSFNTRQLIGVNGNIVGAEQYSTLIERALRSGDQTSSILYLTSRREDSANVTAIPLKNEAGQVLAVLTVALSRAGMVEAQQTIRTTAYGVASAGILLAIIFSLWIAARVSRPIERLAQAAEDVAEGNWDTRVPEEGPGEVEVLAQSFNHMTEQLKNQSEKLVQTERVAAWRELARRLAHELKNPLFPLQITVENLQRARALPEAEFDEVFQESTQTLTTEISNLKAIIGRFSDFSKMPKPELERVDAAEIVRRAFSLYSGGKENAKIDLKLDVSSEPMPLEVDRELMHRALSNLVLNAMDAMPDGGILTLAAHPVESGIEMRVADSGEGLTQEECERLFTPYYTTKQHGTGLGLAIVQSVIADHNGTIAVESHAGRGATFIITLPRANG